MNLEAMTIGAVNRRRVYRQAHGAQPMMKLKSRRGLVVDGGQAVVAPLRVRGRLVSQRRIAPKQRILKQVRDDMATLEAKESARIKEIARGIVAHENSLYPKPPRALFLDEFETGWDYK